MLKANGLMLSLNYINKIVMHKLITGLDEYQRETCTFVGHYVNSIKQTEKVRTLQDKWIEIWKQ